jgi:hypothetical protein
VTAIPALVFFKSFQNGITAMDTEINFNSPSLLRQVHQFWLKKPLADYALFH